MTDLVSRRGFLAAAAAVALGNRQALPAQPRQLRVINRTIDIKGKAAKVFGLAGPDGKPGLQLLLRDRFNVQLINETHAATLVHWHGLTPPSGQDGVPALSQPLLPPAHSHVYDFQNTRSGTHWMHSHAGLQEQQMLAAPLIVRETDQPLWDEQEHVVMLHDFSFRDPAEILAELVAGAGGHAAHGTSGMAMLNDVAFDAFLANDRTLDDPEIVAVEKGGQIRLRIINGAAASNMWIDLGSLAGELIAVDGHAVYPVKGSLFPLAIAQRADIRLAMPSSGGAFPILFRPEGLALRTGIVVASSRAAVSKLPEAGEMAPALGLSLERQLKPVAVLREEPVSRSEMLMLTGGGAGYRWGFNGKPSMHETLFSVRPGERIEVSMHNKTAMAHPMHLHGHYFKIVGVGATRLDGALRDTVLVPPDETVTIMFDAGNPGTWAFHCHHLYHMNSGMMGTMAYTSAA